MICPVCGDKLRAIERSGIEIDICPGCKGIWLDRGELEKLLTVESGLNSQSTNQTDNIRQSQSRRDEQPYRDHDDHDNYNEHGDNNRNNNSHSSDRGSNNNRKRKGSWLGDILGGLGGDD
jgi:Zn-finger nucleic acid-binding protein